VLDKNYQDYEAKFASTTIPRPPHWGGYIVEPHTIEFWQGRSSRMHDRILFTRSDNGTWEKARLAP
jgi:pyridoxamine 5'-phosphate oxidase